MRKNFLIVVMCFAFVLSGCSGSSGGSGAGDNSGNITDGSNNGASGNCPSNFVSVPALSPYTSQAFCVAKYEMKLQYNGAIVSDGNSSGSYDYDIAYDDATERAKYVAKSTVEGRPWVNIKRGENGSATGQGAIEACRSLGTGYDLITNAQWQAVARNIEVQASNWDTGVVGSSRLFAGHSDALPSASLAVTDSADFYSDTGSNPSTSTLGQQRRTYTLSNGETLWDIQGNVAEFVKDSSTTNFGAADYVSQITDTTHPTTGTVGDLTGTTKYLFGPAGDYTNLGSVGYGSLGRDYLFNNGSPKAIVRGGAWENGGYVSGLFSVTFNYEATLSDSFLGFRCTYQP